MGTHWRSDEPYQVAPGFLQLYWKTHELTKACVLTGAVVIFLLLFSTLSVALPIFGGFVQIPFRSLAEAVCAGVFVNSLSVRTDFDSADTGILRRVSRHAAFVTLVAGSGLFCALEWVRRLPYPPAWAATFAFIFGCSLVVQRFCPVRFPWAIAVIIYFALVEMIGFMPDTMQDWDVLSATEWTWPVAVYCVVGGVLTILATSVRGSRRVPR